MAPVFTVSHITLTSSALLLVFATYERYRGADTLNKFPFTQVGLLLSSPLTLLLITACLRPEEEGGPGDAGDRDGGHRQGLPLL